MAREGLPRPGQGAGAQGQGALAPAAAGQGAPAPATGEPAPDATPAPTADTAATPPPAAPRPQRTGLGANAKPAAATPAAATPPPAQPAAPAPAATTSSRRGLRLPESTVARWVLGGVALIVVAVIVVLIARWLVGLDGVKDFLTTYPGETELPETAPVGIPTWLAWQHFFNVFFMVLIVKTGWQVRTQKRPPASWTPKWQPGGRKISLTLWTHQSLDLLWLTNGLIYIVLLFATGHWLRIVPTSWEVVPNALSAALQYASLDWPTENGWVNYNSLQLIAYFATVFIAAPLAIITGVRMSGLWPKKAPRLNKIYPIEIARAIHLPVMFYFVAFTIVHVTLVLATGALRNLNHMFGGQDAVNWLGFIIFVVSLLVIVGGWFAARPIVVAPIAGLFGKVGR
ncbi:MAG TPA: cytochrome b/b6 domain-containing protein [Rhodoglobus sp.]|nr:cytochrome b/b6 domain-containing protein [Rhodoglobus sp.]